MSAAAISDALARARDQFAAALGLERDVAALEAHVLLGHALNKSRAWLLANRGEPLAPADRARFDALCARRAKGEPVAYLTGEREFFGLRFAVSPAVLIPRPDTELLVEWALTLIPEQAPWRILDLGAGSGAIALSIAKHRPLARVTAVDRSADALAVARRNADTLGCTNVAFLQSDWFDAVPNSPRYNLIVSNPPYLAESDPHLTQGDVRFEPRAALAAGDSGLDAFSAITCLSNGFLVDSGHLLFEHGFEQGQAVRALLNAAGYCAIGSRRDLGGHERVTHGQRPASA